MKFNQIASEIEQLLQQPEVAVPVVLTAVILARVYLGSVLFHPRYVKVWAVIRKIGVPFINRLVIKRFGFNVTETIPRVEYVCKTPASPTTVATKLCNEYPTEVPLLVEYVENWEGKKETGTLVVYHGMKPWPSAPNWLRARQTHLTFFEHEGGYVVTAHDECNSYRVDTWPDYLFQKSYSPTAGAGRTTEMFTNAGVEYSVEDVF